MKRKAYFSMGRILQQKAEDSTILNKNASGYNEQVEKISESHVQSVNQGMTKTISKEECIYIIGKGDDVTKSSKEIWKEKLKEHSIKVVDEFDKNLVKIVMASEFLTLEQIIADLKLTPTDPLPKLISIQWILDCVDGNCTLSNFDQYQWTSSCAPACLTEPEDNHEIETWRQNKSQRSYSKLNVSKIPNAFETDCRKYHELITFIKASKKQCDLKSKLACQVNPDVPVEPPTSKNRRLVQEMEWFEMYYGTVQKDQHRIFGYKRAANIFRALPFEVTLNRLNEISKHTRGIGPKILNKTKEVLQYGKSALRRRLEGDPVVLNKIELSKLHGIGPSVAKKLYDMGYHSIDNLRKAVARNEKIPGLSVSSIQALPYYEDLLERIPRAEVTEIGNFIKETAQTLWPDNENRKLVLEIAGSYRRGKSNSGDVDIIMTYEKSDRGQVPLIELIEALHARGFLSADLHSLDGLIPEHGRVPERQTYMGICKLPNGQYHRRLDMKVYPSENFAFALLHFTGSDHFNRSIRYFAKRCGLQLNDTGVYQGLEHCKDPSRSLLKCKTEKEIFDFFHLEYREPRQRSCYDQDIWAKICEGTNGSLDAILDRLDE